MKADKIAIIIQLVEKNLVLSSTQSLNMGENYIRIHQFRYIIRSSLFPV